MEKFTLSKNIENKPNVIEQFRKKFGNNLYIAMAIISSFVLSPKEASAQSSLNDKNTIENINNTTENKAEIEFNKQKEFLITWFSNRKIENHKFQKKFKEIRPEVMERLKDVTLVESSNILGSTEWLNDTVFYNVEVLNNPELTSDFTHELAHDAFPTNRQPKEEFQTKMPQYMISMIVDAIQRSGDEGLSSVAVFKKYYQRPEEIYARICAFRLVFGIKPDQNITTEELDEMISKINNKEINDDNSNTLLMTITKHDSLLKLINNLP